MSSSPSRSTLGKRFTPSRSDVSVLIVSAFNPDELDRDTTLAMSRNVDFKTGDDPVRAAVIWSKAT